MIIQKKIFTIFVAGVILLTSCFMSHKNKRCLKEDLQKQFCSYQDVKLIMDTLTEENRVDKNIFRESNFHVFDSYDFIYLQLKSVNDSVVFGWFSGKRNDTIFDIILALTREQIIHNVHKKTTFFDSQGRFYYMGDVGVTFFPEGQGGVPDSIRVYMDSISPVCGADLDEKFEVEYFPILKKDSITIKFH